MSGNKDETLRQFCDVTGADEARSRFFLESSNWQLDVALSSFYENGGNADDAPSNPAAVPTVVPTLSDSDMDSPPVSPVAQKKKKEKKRQNTKFATLGSLQQDSSSEEEEGQAFYAGGSERSGQQIIGPGKNKKDIVSEVFQSVRERGAVIFDEEGEQSSSGPSRVRIFGGVGHRLGQGPDDSQEVANPTARPQQEESRQIRLCLYREGFTVDSGPLRPYHEPENAEFLNYIRRGEFPPEMAGGSGSVRFSLEDRRRDPMPVSSARSTQPFRGKGHVLGSDVCSSPTPPTVGATAPVASDAADRSANQRAAQLAVALDDTLPTTTIQFRLADGSRLTGRFNHSHTVGTLREFISRAEPAYQLQPFTLLTAFPSSELTDNSATLVQANLLNSTVMQRLK